MRSETEIQSEIRRLRTQRPHLADQTTEDGDRLVDALEAQLDVLVYDIDEETITANMTGGEVDDPMLERKWSEYAGDSAMAARRWLDGADPHSPSSDWQRWV